MLATSSPVRAEVCVVRPAHSDGARITSATSLMIEPDEQAFRGHYPGLPLFPGVCVVECAHRSSLATAPGPDGGAAPQSLQLTALKSARFRNPVFPGDELSVRIDWLAEPPGWRCAARIHTERGDVARANLYYRRVNGADAAASRRPQPPAATPRPGKLLSDLPEVTPVEILRLMPHRYPMLLVDRVVDIVPGEWIVAVKAITYTDIWNSSAVAKPTVEQLAFPPTLLVESWLQAAGVLTTWDHPNPDPLAGEVMLLGGITNAQFHRPVLPGELVEHRVRILLAHRDAMVFEGESVVGDSVSMTVERVSMALRPPQAVLPAAAASAAGLTRS